ncbi:hypothetical protein GOP47_0001533 [Adiantum capillus-veneris]|uniref:Uncharacterized protein n=1 Tax=Adiantum capillus-veneris TaxID=13818 RepID=A0A9D4ZQT2_ADICA|nr:hypothetical protein GOP47_0001533 [Adiantum capillus-veneris]
MPGLRSRPLIDRRLRSMGASSSESNSLQSSQSISSSDEGRSGYRHMILHIFTRRMILDVIAFIWRLPGMIGGLLKKEEKLLDTIEDDINEATDVVKMGSRVVEELAEGVEKVADAIDNKDLEKIAKVVEEDAKRVEVIMDKVKARTKVVHDELEEVASSLGESMQDVEEVVAKVQVKPRDASMQEAAKLLAVLPSSSTPTSHLTDQ